MQLLAEHCLMSHALLEDSIINMLLVTLQFQVYFILLSSYIYYVKFN